MVHIHTEENYYITEFPFSFLGAILYFSFNEIINIAFEHYTGYFIFISMFVR